MSVAELFGTAAHKHTGIEWMDYETQLPTHNEILYSIKKAPFVTEYNKWVTLSNAIFRKKIPEAK